MALCPSICNEHRAALRLHRRDHARRLFHRAGAKNSGLCQQCLDRRLLCRERACVTRRSTRSDYCAPGLDDETPQKRGRYPARYLRKMVDHALRRLRVDRIELFQLHSWMASAFYELDWLETLNALRVARHNVDAPAGLAVTGTQRL